MFGFGGGCDGPEFDDMHETRQAFRQLLGFSERQRETQTTRLNEGYDDLERVGEEDRRILGQSSGDRRAFGGDLRDEYRSRRGLRDDFAQRAGDWASEERKSREAARAIADVNFAIDADMEAKKRSLERSGVNPSDVRYGLPQLVDTSAALARVTAGENARRGVDREGMGYTAAAIDMNERVGDRSLGEGALALEEQKVSSDAMFDSENFAIDAFGSYPQLAQTETNTLGTLGEIELARASGKMQRVQNKNATIGGVVGDIAGGAGFALGRWG